MGSYPYYPRKSTAPPQSRQVVEDRSDPGLSPEAVHTDLGCHPRSVWTASGDNPGSAEQRLCCVSYAIGKSTPGMPGSVTVVVSGTTRLTSNVSRAFDGMFGGLPRSP